MTQPTSRSIIKAIACSKPTISEHWSKWKHNGTLADQCKQRGALCHTGLAKDRGGHLINQPRLSLFDKCWETTVAHQISIMKRKTKKRINVEHGEENVQVKPHAYVHRWVDQISVKDSGVFRIFLAISKKLKNSNKKVEKLQKLINEVQKKNKAKQKKLKSVLSCRKARLHKQLDYSARLHK